LVGGEILPPWTLPDSPSQFRVNQEINDNFEKLLLPILYRIFGEIVKTSLNLNSLLMALDTSLLAFQQNSLSDTQFDF